MRCVCCQKNLNDFESTARHAEHNYFLDMCRKCLQETQVPYVGRDDLSKIDVPEDDDFSEELYEEEDQ